MSETLSAAEIRREARRRRILRNSDDRLRKIKGEFCADSSQSEKDALLKSDDDKFISQSFHTAEAPVNHITAPSRCSNILSSEEPHLPTPPMWQSTQTETVDRDLFAESLTDEPYQPTVVARLLQARLHIIVLAIVVRVLLHLDFGYFFGEMILMPPLVMQLSTLLLTPNLYQENAGGMIGLALAMSGLSKSRLHRLLKLAHVVMELLRDLILYLFVFVAVHVLL